MTPLHVRTFLRTTGSTCALLLLATGCVAKDNRYGSLVRPSISSDVGFISRTSARIRGTFSLAPVCEVEDADDGITFATIPIDGWMEISGLEKATTYKLHCITPTETTDVSFRTLDDTVQMVGTNGFVSQGEVVSAAVDCYPANRSLAYHKGSGKLFATAAANHYCYSEYDGASWKTTRINNQFRSTLPANNGGASDAATFPDGSTIVFADDIDDAGATRNRLRMFTCMGPTCTGASSWSSVTNEASGSAGLAVAMSNDGKRAAVSTISPFGSGSQRRPAVVMCDTPNGSAADCAAESDWTFVQFTGVTVSGNHRTEAKFDDVGNLWVMMPNVNTPVSVCPALSFPCANVSDWTLGALMDPTDGFRNYVVNNRPHISAVSGAFRVIAPLRSGSTNILSFAECTSLNCATTTAGVFTGFTTFERNTGVFPTSVAYIFGNDFGFSVHYQLTASPFNVRQQRCNGSFSLCNDPRASEWTLQAPLADSNDHPGLAAGLQRTFVDAKDRQATILVDPIEETVFLQYLLP